MTGNFDVQQQQQLKQEQQQQIIIMSKRDRMHQQTLNGKQQGERHYNRNRRMHLHFPLQLQQSSLPLSMPMSMQLHFAIVIAFGLFFAIICVSGQIDGYTAGVDYPAYEAVPKGLSFNCQGRLPGYYADTETRCQVWHWCLHSGHQYSFLCPNGTVFNQAVRVCDWWTNVNCPGAEQLYENNEELYRPTEENQQTDI